MEKNRTFDHPILKTGFWALAFLLALVVGFYLGKYRIHLYNWFAVRTGLAVVGNPTPVPPSVNETAAAEQNPVDRVVAIINEQDLGTSAEVADFARTFIAENTIHLADEDFYEYAYDTPRLIEMMLATYEEGAPPPHSLCDTSSYALERILRKLGYKTRVVHVFSDDFDTLRSHTFLEYFNHETQAWEIQDTDYNLYYIDTRDGGRLSVMNLVFEDLTYVEPVSPDPNKVALAREVLLPHYYEAAVVLGASEHSFFLLNTNRFDIHNQAIFSQIEDTSDMVEYMGAHFGDFPAIITRGYPSGMEE